MTDEELATALRNTANGEVLNDFAKLPLPQRMRVAADVLEEANKRHLLLAAAPWTSSQCRYFAEQMQREDADTLRRDKQVEELARLIAEQVPRDDITDTHRRMARELIDAGWTKATGDE